MLMPPQSNYLSLARYLIGSHATGEEYTSEVVTREKHHEDSKETVVIQLYRPPLLLSRGSDINQ